MGEGGICLGENLGTRPTAGGKFIFWEIHAEELILESYVLLVSSVSLVYSKLVISNFEIHSETSENVQQFAQPS